MEKMELEIGQQITIKEPFEIKYMGREVQVKKGDMAFIDSSKVIHYTTGLAAGAVQFIKDDIKLNGYDHENIVSMIMSKLEYFELEAILEDYGIDHEDFSERITEVLFEVL